MACAFLLRVLGEKPSFFLSPTPVLQERGQHGCFRTAELLLVSGPRRNTPHMALKGGEKRPDDLAPNPGPSLRTPALVTFCDPGDRQVRTGRGGGQVTLGRSPSPQAQRGPVFLQQSHRAVGSLGVRAPSETGCGILLSFLWLRKNNRASPLERRSWPGLQGHTPMSTECEDGRSAGRNAKERGEGAASLAGLLGS